MDNLTHSLVGVLLARAGLQRLVPRATLLAVAAANLPDLDIVAGAGGSLGYLAVHRGFTHALFWTPLLALVPLPFWYLLERHRRPGRRQWLFAWLIGVVGILSHIGLDWLNVYGIRLGLPFNRAWLHLDLLHIVDIWVWALLLLFTLGPLLGRLVAGEIGARRTPARTSAVIALVLLTAYIGARALLHQQAVATLQSRLYRGRLPQRVLALPTLANPLAWTGVVETGDAWLVVPVRLGGEFDPETARLYYKPEALAARAAVASSETGRVFLDFSQAPCWRMLPAAGGEGRVLVQVDDLRFGLPGEGAFRAEFEIDGAGRVVAQRFAFGGLVARRP